MKKVSLGVIFLAFVLTGHAQTVEFQEGDKQLEITLNPVFNYVGQLFTERGSTLSLSSGSVVYRKFLDDKKARRISLNVFGDSDLYEFVAANKYSKTRRKNTSINIGLGSDWHYPKEKWNFYGGYQINLGIGYNDSGSYTEFYEGASSGSGNRKIEVENKGDWRFSAGPELLGGLQYHFNDILYTGIELRGYFSLVYNTPSKTTTKEYEFVNQISPNDSTTNETEGGFEGTLSTSNLVLFKLGANF
jgi:hypothetical protein